MKKQVKDMNTILTPPSAAPVIQALRSIGYNAKTAVADLVDNSIDAKSLHIRLCFEYEILGGYIKISDNGIGMSEDQLQCAMNIGSKDPRHQRDPKELGRFGMGLKTASFSLGKRLSVLTKQDGIYYERCWDLDHVSGCNKWQLFTKIPEEVKREMGNIEGSQGTIIIIDKLDRFMRVGKNKIKRSSFFSKATRIQRHLEFVYHSLLESRQINISINGNDLEAWNPFMSNHLSVREGEQTTWRMDGYKMKVKFYVLPHSSMLNKIEFERAGGEKGWRDQQGFYIYRENRLLHYGGWLGLFPKDTHSQLARIRIDIPNTADIEWQVDVKKSMVTIPENAKKILFPISKLARDMSREIYFFRAQKAVSTGKIKGSLNTWEQSGKDTGPLFLLNRSHPILLELLNSLSLDQAKMLNLFINLVEIGSPINITSAPQNSDQEVQVYTDHQLDMVTRFAKTMLDLDIVTSDEEIIDTMMLQPGFETLNKKTLIHMLKKGNVKNEH